MDAKIGKNQKRQHLNKKNAHNSILEFRSEVELDVGILLLCDL